MSIGGIFLASFGGFYGGTFGNLLAQWEQLGVFSYVLPFLLIFALIFGILQRIDVFKGNKGINAVIALSVSLMSLQFNVVPIFFSDIFPRLGIGLSVILAMIILTGLFMEPKYSWIGLALGGVVFAIIIGTTFEFGSLPFWFWAQQNMATIIIVGILLAIVIGMIFGPPDFQPEGKSIYARSIKGE